LLGRPHGATIPSTPGEGPTTGFQPLRAVVTVLLLAAAADACAVLRADYRFQGNLNSSVAGAPALTSFGAGNVFGTDSIAGASTPALAFPEGGGLTLPNANTIVPGPTYTIALLVRLASVSGYRKYIDFKNRTSDNGVYVLDGALNFYNFATGPTAPITANAYRTIVLTRDAAGQVVGYVNGAQQLGFADTTSAGLIDAANTLNFFFDDTVTTGEQSAGAVARIQVYDNALSAAEVAGLGLAPPPAGIPALDPRSLLLLAATLLLLGLVALRPRPA
jgi:hypothetical protein